jgi:hypothetical protein
MSRSDRTDEEQLKRRWTRSSPTSFSTSPATSPSTWKPSSATSRVTGVFVSTGVYPHLHGKPAREEDFVPLEGDPPADLDYMDGKRWCETVMARSLDFP